MWMKSTSPSLNDRHLEKFPPWPTVCGTWVVRSPASPPQTNYFVTYKENNTSLAIELFNDNNNNNKQHAYET